MGLFKAYDIRGVYPEEINPEVAFKIGIIYGSIRRGQGGEVFIGKDSRLTGDALLSAFAAGALGEGVSLTRVGMVHTPLIYWLTTRNQGSEGVMVTASHNPPQYNGFKISAAGKAYSYETLYRRIERALEGQLEVSPVGWMSAGRMSERSYEAAYVEDVLSRVRPPEAERQLKVVVDAGNGSCGFAADVMRRLGLDVVGLYLEPDGEFPHHTPDPLRLEAYGDLSAAVVREGADMGVLFDGDGDRVGFVDEKGMPIGGDAAAMLLAGDALLRRPGTGVVLNVVMSQAVFDFVRSAGGRPVMVRVGHSYIQDAMEKEGAAFAAEISGHFYFADEYYGFDDAVYAALRMVSLLSRDGRPLSSIVSSLPRYQSTPESRVRCPDDVKFKVVEELRVRYAAEGLRVIDIDGVRVEVDGGWWIVRASNTEPALVLRAEARTRELLEELEARMMRDVDEVCRA